MNKLYKPRVVLKFAAFILLMIGGMDQAFSQGVTTATIIGKATDNEGSEMPGANVTAFHNPTGTIYGISTRGDGRFTLPNLRIGGPYTITISFIGYEVQKVENVFLTLGETRSFEFQLKQSATELGEVVISGAGYDKDRTGASVAFDNNTIRKMPTITRSAADIYRLTPSSDGNSFAGRNDQFNNFSLNGAIFNNPFGLDAATPGGQTDAQPISLDAIDQIQVSIAPYDVTQSGFTGASVNAVTKSGTNKFSGTAFGFYRTDALTGSKIKGEDVFVPDLTQLQAGFSFGGPIIKDKLFFFTNFELERRDDLGSSFRAARPGLSGGDVSRVTAADLDAVGAALRSIGYEPGAYEGYTHETNNQKGIIKLDWNINKNNTLTAIYNFLDASKQKPANPSALGRRGPDQTTLQFYNSGYQINNKINSFIVELKSLIGNKFSNKAQIGYSVFDDSRDPFSTPFPVLNIAENGSRYIVAGHEPFSINNLLNQKVFQFNDNFEIYAGDHTVTLGTSFEKFEFDNSFNLNAYGGTFVPDFESVSDFLASVSNGDFNNAVLNAETIAFKRDSANTWASPETNVGQFALYAQDKWLVNEKLTLTYGLRVDFPLYFDTKKKVEESIAEQIVINGFDAYDPTIVYYDENANETLLDSKKLPDQKPLFSPRIGINYDIAGDQKSVIRGGTGLFTGRFPFVWVGNQVANPNSFFYTVTDPDFKFPQVWRTNIGIDKAFGEGWKASVDLIYTKDVNAMIVRNYGLKTPEGSLTGADDRKIYRLPSQDGTGVTDRTQVFSPFAYNGAGGFVGQNAYVFTNTDVGRTINLTFELKRNWSNGLYTTIAYNYLDAQDASSIDAEISSDAYNRNPAFGNVNTPELAPSLFGNKHRFVGTANKTFSYGNGKHATTLSLFFEYAKGGRYSYTYSGDINGDGSDLNDLIYIPTESEITSMAFKAPFYPTDPTENEQREALEAYISQDEYLNGRRGDYAEKYATLSPWYSRYDFRLLQDYKFTNGNSIQFSIDILNIGNFINSEWGVRQFPTNTQPIGVSVSGTTPTYNFDPRLKSTFTNDASLQSRWQMQFGLRYTF
jgi:Carboxypeptidase regulatory-like domain